MGRAINLKTWKRREAYHRFLRYERPFFSVCVEVDVTGVWRRSRAANRPSFFLTSLFLMTRAVNQTEAFRLRLRKGGVWLHDRVGAGTPILRGDETFGYAYFMPHETLTAFAADGERTIALAKTQKQRLKEHRSDDLVFHSTLPWLRFTSFTNALRRDDCIPRIVFGKCSREGRHVVMPLAIEVHHALVDGLDVARFLERFQAELSAFRG